MQTSYSIDQSAGLPGQLADAGHQDVISAINAAAAVAFGKLMVKGASEGLCKVPALAADITTKELVLGVSVKSHALESARDANPPSWPQNSAVPCLRKGRIYVLVEEDVVAGDPVFVRYAAGGSGPGSFGKSAGASERAALDGATYYKGALTGQLAILEVNLVA